MSGSQNFFKRLFSILIILTSCFLVVACSKNASTSTVVKKGGGGKVNPKPDQQAVQRALVDKVLLTIDKTSMVTSANANTLSFNSLLRVNDKEKNVPWKFGLKLKVGENLQTSLELPDSYGLADLGLKLILTDGTKRFEKTPKKEDLGYLVLPFLLTRKNDDSTHPSKESLLLVLVDLNKVKNSAAVVNSEVVYPIPDDFSLDDWIEKQIKKN